MRGQKIEGGFRIFRTPVEGFTTETRRAQRRDWSASGLAFYFLWQYTCPRSRDYAAVAKLALLLGYKNLNEPGKYRWLRIVIPFAVVYLVVGALFPNPPASDPTLFIWRLASWLICGLAFAVHIGLELFRLRNSPFNTGLHAAASVALGAFALAGAANIHALTAGTGNQRLLTLALVIWPIITGLPAFVVAWAAAAVLARVRPEH